MHIIKSSTNYTLCTHFHVQANTSFQQLPIQQLTV